MNKLSLEDCFANNTCWPKDRLEKYQNIHGDEEGAPVFTILKDPDISIVDKMWVVEAADILTDMQMHELAILFAEHVMTDANVAGKRAIEEKKKSINMKYWGYDSFDNSSLKEAELAAWKESKHYKRSKAAAYAAKKNALIAFRGAYALSAGAYGEAVDPIEKRWQWKQIENVIFGEGK